MSFKEIKDAVEDLQKTVKDFQALNDREIAEIKKNGSADATLRDAVEKANKGIDAAMARVDALETAMNRKDAPRDEKDTKEMRERKAAFSKFLRKGDQRFSEQEIKLMSVDSDPNGGYLVEPEMSSEIVKIERESSPTRQLCSVQTISTDVFEIPVDFDDLGYETPGETETRNETSTPELDMLRIPTHEMSAMPSATQKLLDDAEWNIEAYLNEKVGNRFARVGATWNILGTGVKQARGMLTYAHGTSWGQVQQVASGDANLVTADGLIDLVYSLKEAYAKNASFMINRLAIPAIRKLKDDNKQYLWGVGLNGPQSATLLGYPVFQASDMPLVAAGNLPVIFGDFKRFYQIVDRIGIRILRDPYTKKGKVLFYTTKREGGDVKNFEAAKILKIATSV